MPVSFFGAGIYIFIQILSRCAHYTVVSFHRGYDKNFTIQFNFFIYLQLVIIVYKRLYMKHAYIYEL